jgi:hypothetical protein
MTLRLIGLTGLTFALFATACASPVPEPEAPPQDQAQANAAPLCEVKPRIGSNIVARLQQAEGGRRLPGGRAAGHAQHAQAVGFRQLKPGGAYATAHCVVVATRGGA